MPQPDKSAKSRILSYVLTPASWLYGAVTYLRNKFYDWGIFRSVAFDIPVVSVGNLSVGGTGKTPHVEYIVESLSSVYNIAVLSRGYKRKTRGFVLASPHSTPDTVGDEPYQIYSKYGGRIKVAVCENRAKGISELMAIDPGINLVLLDDAFQHRGVQPKVNVLLIDYSRPVYADRLLPLGRLRENRQAMGRADIVVVTKVPSDVKPIDLRVMKKELDLWAYQKLFFSRISYGELSPVFGQESRFTVYLGQLTRSDAVLLVSGIANPRPFVRYFKNYPVRIRVSHFPDHHDFTRADLTEIAKAYENMKGARKLIITTEKDAVRLAHNPYFPETLKPYIFFLPISVDMVGGLDDTDLIVALRQAIDLPARRQIQDSSSRPEPDDDLQTSNH